MRHQILLYHNISQKIMRKIACLFSILGLYLLLGTTIAADNSSATIAPPPAVNLTNLFTLNYSTIDNRFISSERIENLDLSTVTVNSTTCTNFRINFFNRSQSTNLQNVTILNTTGSWTHLVSSKSSLSCSLVFQSTNSTYALLKFANQTRFEIMFRGDKTKFPTQMTNLTNTDIPSKVVLGELCNIVSFNKSAYLFNPNNTSGNTTWVPLNVPNPTLFQGGSPDFNFVVTNLTLHMLNITNNTYNVITKLPNYQRFDIRNGKNQVILIGNNATSTDNITYSVNQTIIVAVIQNTTQGPQFKVISNDNISAEVKSPNIPIIISPQMTKVSFFFRPPPVNGTPSDPQIVIKSFDYTKLTFSNFTFQNVSEFKDIMKNAQPNELNIGDNFLLISNRSGLAANSSLPVSWHYYQYVAQNIVLLRKRVIPSNQTAALSSLLKADIDPIITNTMIVIESSNVTNGIKYTQVDLGSLAANNRVIPAANPPHINFTIPTSTQKFPSQRSFDWTYLDSTLNSSSLTQVTTFNFNNTATNKIDKNNFTLPGNWTIFAQNKDCKFVSKVGSQNYTILRFDKQAKIFTGFADVTTLISSAVTNSSKYLISLACDRFSVDNKIYAIVASNNTNNTSPTFNLIQNNLTTFIWSSTDDNLTTVIVNSSLWRYRPESNNSFVKIFDSPNPFFATNKLYQSQGRIVVTGTNSTSAQAFAFIDKNGNLSTVFNWTFTQYGNTPLIKVSTNATKIMIVGPFTPQNASNAVPKVDAFAIDYKNAVFSNVSIPQNLNVDPLNVFINLQDKFLYARQLSNTSNTPGLQQFVFLFHQDLYLKPSIVTNLTQPPAGYTWKKTLVVNTPDNQFLVMQEGQQAVNSVTYVIVNSRQVLANQSNHNNNNGASQVAGTVVNGKVKLCPVGCNDCSSGTCAGCFNGYVLDSTAYTCLVCAPNCKTCSSSNTSICYTCFEKSYLSDSSCLPCGGSCTACSGSATSCSSCPPRQSFINGSCTNCGPFCHNCTNSTVCITCIRGFTLTTNKTCRSCASSCSSCNPSNITECTSCAKGLQLSNGVCVSCPNNCEQCNGGVCSTCSPGFQANSAGVCISQCQTTCATCADNQPSICLSCYSGANYNSSSNTCSLDLTCNSNSTCTDCGNGFNHILVGTTCMQCPNISNCVQCSSTDSSSCAMCLQGFYINSGVCSSCNSTCITCVSFQVCTSCAVGYTLPHDLNAGSCIKCTSPCLTCIGSSTSCSSCINGVTKKGWKCLNNTHVSFSLVLTAEPATVLNGIDSIVSSFVDMAKKTNPNIDLSSVTFDSFKQGSTIVGGTVTDVGSSALTVSAGQTFGGFTVSSASFTQYGTSIDQPTSDNKIGLIVGLAVGIPVAIAIIVIVSCIMYRKRKQAELISASNPNHHDHVELNQLEPVKVNESQMVSAKVKLADQPVGSQQLWDKDFTPTY